jgi:hypothetical protein
VIRAAAIAVLLATLALCALVPRVASAAPSYDNCTTILPPRSVGTYMIEDPGTYCFDRDLTGQIGIQVYSDDVTIDCKGFRLTLAQYQEYTIGIAAMVHRGLVVRNCDVRNFERGIQLFTGSPPRDNGGHLVEDNEFHGNRWGIEVSGPGSIVRRNRVSGAEFGIGVDYDTTVQDNLVVGDRDPGGRRMHIGIWASGQGVVIERNVVRGLFADAPHNVQGIYAASNDVPGAARVHDNIVVGEGEDGTVGIACHPAKNTADDNVVTGFPTGLDGCTDAGDNDVSP